MESTLSVFGKLNQILTILAELQNQINSISASLEKLQKENK